MATEIFMPRLTHDMQTGILIRWLKADGDRVQSGEPLFEVETDKAATEVSSETNGILRDLRYKEGDEIPVGSTMAFIYAAEESSVEGTGFFNAPMIKEETKSERIKPPERKINVKKVYNNKTSIIASPLAKQIAQKNNIDLTKIVGSGPRGRIIEADVNAFIEKQKELLVKTGPMEYPSEESFGFIPLTRIQKTTGERLLKSVQSAPHFVLEVDVEMSEVQHWRDQYNTKNVHRVSYTGILVKVVATALTKHPRVNGQLDGDKLKWYQDANIGVAMNTPQGLLVPVIHQANKLNLLNIQKQLEELQQQANMGRIKEGFLRGGTFTISNLGMYGVDRFQAIINPPEAAVLAVGRIRELPWVIKNKVQICPVMTLRLSIDHRILDGSVASPFLIDIKQLLEQPDLSLGS